MNHFAVQDIWWHCSFTELILYVRTSALVHLWTFYTDVQPLRHPKSRILRGVELPWDTYFCFVAWKSLEQDEPGDTLVHTFTWTDWPVCLTRWFTHRGQVAGEWSPSCGPLFKRHRSPMIEEILYPAHDTVPQELYLQVIPPLATHWEAVRYADSYFDPTWGAWGRYVGSLVFRDWWIPGWPSDTFIFTDLKWITDYITCFTFSLRAGRSMYPYGQARLFLILDGTTYISPSYGLGGGFYWFHWDLPLNPHTGKPWTREEVRLLKGGVSLSRVGSFGWSCCDAIRITVRSCHIREY